MPVCIRLRVQVQQAVSVAKGQARLRSIATASGGGRTIFSVQLPVERAPIVQEAAAPSQQAAAADADELAGASDSLADAAAAPAPAAGSTLPDAGSAPEAGSSEPAQTASSLVCAALDDDFMSRMIYNGLFSEFLHADPDRSVVLGANAREQLSFVDVVLGNKRASLEDAMPPLRPADIVLLDQNIDLDQKAHLLGSDVAGQLHAAGYRGVTCIITGASQQQIQELSTKPGVDLVLEKGTPFPTLARRLQAVHEEKRAAAGVGA